MLVTRTKFEYKHRRQIIGDNYNQAQIGKNCCGLITAAPTP